MRSYVAMGALALFLFTARAEAFPGAAVPMSAPLDASAYSYFLSGYLDYRGGNLDRALESYQKALKFAGDEPEILYEIANVYVKKNRIQEARATLQTALAADPGHTRSRYLLAGILAVSGESGRALEEYRRVVEEDPEYYEEGYLHIATLLAEKGEFPQAEEALGQLIARNPESYLAFYYRGRIRATQKNFDGALADYDEALKIAPGFDAALLDSGAVLEILDRNAEAEERYKKALQASPNNPFIRERLGRVLIREKKIEQAVGQYEELKKFASTNPDVRTRLGLLYLDRDRFDDAINEFTFVLASDPGNGQVRFFLGTAYEEKGAVTEAQEAYRKVPEGSPAYREAMLHLALSLSRQKKYDEAIAIVRDLRAKNPDDVDLMLFLGGQLQEAGRYEEALAVVSEAVAKAPANPAAWFSLGLTYDKLGMLDNVIAAMEKAIALDPRNAELVIRLTQEVVTSGGFTTLMVTHSMAQAVQLGNRVLVMHRGRIVYDIAELRRQRLAEEDLLQLFDQLRWADRLDDSAAAMLRREYV